MFWAGLPLATRWLKTVDPSPYVVTRWGCEGSMGWEVRNVVAALSLLFHWQHSRCEYSQSSLRVRRLLQHAAERSDMPWPRRISNNRRRKLLDVTDTLQLQRTGSVLPTPSNSRRWSYEDVDDIVAAGTQTSFRSSPGQCFRGVEVWPSSRLSGRCPIWRNSHLVLLARCTP